MSGGLVYIAYRIHGATNQYGWFAEPTAASATKDPESMCLPSQTRLWQVPPDKHLTKLLAKANKFEWIRCVTPTAFNGEWSSCLGADAVHETLDTGWLQDLLDRQAAGVEQGVRNRGLLILDDALGSVSFKSPIWTRIAASSRHYQVTVWVSTQHLFKLPPVVRYNADYVFVLGPQPKKTVLALWEEFQPRGVGDEKQMAKLAKMTADYGCCLIDVARLGMHRIKAPARVEFRIRQ